MQVEHWKQTCHKKAEAQNSHRADKSGSKDTHEYVQADRMSEHGDSQLLGEIALAWPAREGHVGSPLPDLDCDDRSCPSIE